MVIFLLQTFIMDDHTWISGSLVVHYQVAISKIEAWCHQIYVDIFWEAGDALVNHDKLLNLIIETQPTSLLFLFVCRNTGATLLQLVLKQLIFQPTGPCGSVLLQKISKHRLLSEGTSSRYSRHSCIIFLFSVISKRINILFSSLLSVYWVAHAGACHTCSKQQKTWMIHCSATVRCTSSTSELLGLCDPQLIEFSIFW